MTGGVPCARCHRESDARGVHGDGQVQGVRARADVDRVAYFSVVGMHSFHHAFRAPVDDVAYELFLWLWCQPMTADVDRCDDPDSAWLQRMSHLNGSIWVLVREGGLTRVWGDRGQFDELWVTDVARRLGCDAMYGHYNDRVDNWRWLHLVGGEERDAFWYLGQPEYVGWRTGTAPLPKAELGAAFRAFGTTYPHEHAVCGLNHGDRRIGVSWRRR